MSGRPEIEESYRKGNDVINYVVYQSKTAPGKDEVLQHKLMGITETSHITLHPDGTVNFRIKRSKLALENAIRNNLIGYAPAPSDRVKQFIRKVKAKI